MGRPGQITKGYKAQGNLRVIVMFIVLFVMIVVYIYTHTYISSIYSIYAFIYVKRYQIVLSIYVVTVHQLYLGELLKSNRLLFLDIGEGME